MICQKDRHEVPNNRMHSGYCSALHQYMSCYRCVWHEKNLIQKEENMISENQKIEIHKMNTADLKNLHALIEYELETRSEEELINNPVYRQMIKQGKV